MDKKQHILRLTPRQWQEWFAAHGEPSYRVDQVLDWLYRKMVADPGEMTNFSKELRRSLSQELDCKLPEMSGNVSDSGGTTSKYRLTLHDGAVIESVLMDQGGRYSFCVSTQAGCPLGCTFCATGRGGFVRDLFPEEITGQIVHLARICGAVGNVVFMGMGEPLLNTGALLPALEALVDPSRLALGLRRVTVSTAGIPDGIRQLARHGTPPGLALSLHSPFDAQRSDLMPVNRRYPLEEVLDACGEYAGLTGRTLMLEYVMLGGVNTSPEAARGLARIAARLGAKVNLIAFNSFEAADYAPPERGEVAAFRSILEKQGVLVIQRYRRGAGIGAGCGQLAGAGPK